MEQGCKEQREQMDKRYPTYGEAIDLIPVPALHISPSSLTAWSLIL